MKQAKFALTATAVLAVIGGAIAFKARTNTPTLYVKTGAQCTQPIQGYTTINGTSVVSFATKATPATSCPTTSIRLLKVE